MGLRGWEGVGEGFDPDPDIQGLFWAEPGLPACQDDWAWALEEEEEAGGGGAMELKTGPGKLLLDEPGEER